MPAKSAAQQKAAGAALAAKRGETPVSVGDLPPNDEVTVELRLRGYKVAKRTISFGGKRLMELSIPLEKAR